MDGDEQPDAETHQAKSGSVPSTGDSVLVELERVTLLAHGFIHQSRSSLNPILS